MCQDGRPARKGVRKTSSIASAYSAKGVGRSRSRLPTSSTREIRSSQRSLASAAAIDYRLAQDDFVPFEGSQNAFQQKPNIHSALARPEGISTLREFDPSSTIVIRDSPSTIPRRFRTVNAISGEIAEIQQTLHACLQVGRFERAAVLMRRLNKIHKSDAPELLACHNNYLRELSLAIMRTRDEQLLKSIHKWFEVDLRGVGVTPDPITYFCMIQASLKQRDSKKAERAIRRYLQLATEAGLRDEVMKVMLGLMNEQDFGRITSIAPMLGNGADAILEDDVTNYVATLETSSSEPATAIPEIRGVNQKGLGLSSLKKALSIFTDPAPMPPDGTLKGSPQERDRAFAYQRQKRLENDNYDAAIDRWRSENTQLKKLGINNALRQEAVGSMMWTWQEALVPLVVEEIRKSNEAESMSTRSQDNQWRGLYGPYLQFLPPDKVSAITILTCMSEMSKQLRGDASPRVTHVVTAIGQAIQDESIAESIRNNNRHNYWQGLTRHERSERLTKMLKKRQVHDSLTKLIANADAKENFEWSLKVKTRIGAILLSHLLEIAKIEVTCKNSETGSEIKEMQPALFHTYRYLAGRSTGIIRFNQAMISKLAKAPVASTLAKSLPMVVEPKPWTDYRVGGFLQSPMAVVRFKQEDLFARKYAIAASRNGDMAQVFAGLDVLARTPWKINRSVFEIMSAAWNTGDEIAKIPPENPKAEYPTEPPPSDDVLVRQRWFKQMKEIDNWERGVRSERSFQNFQLEVARAFLNEEFYFPHNVDFRGRAYPMSPFFNHMGADNCRGLLMFARGKELGPNGLRWLKIQIASLYGYDKASFGDREKFTDNHLTEIYDSANKALNGNRWWLKADDPWQCLAACIELRDALQSPDPQRYVSHIPIHQDGTCNGLQHYAALGGDVAGAKQVNLEPGDHPSDVYTAVADMVQAEISKEAGQGSELARLLDGKVTRKIVKQPVMTNVYGVTFIGAKAQVRKQIDEALTDFPDTESINRDAASSYITKKIFKSLSTMFSGAHDLQHWLADCANRISNSLTREQLDWIESESHRDAASSIYSRKPIGQKQKARQETSFRTPVIWTTPLKMPVVQPYRTSAMDEVLTNLQRIQITAPSAADPIDRRKQRQGFPPNFIHSLDATHMLLSALKSNELALTFAAVHDSFWTHAADVPVMNRILRDAFIRMHSEDIIGRLAAEFAARYKGSMRLTSLNVTSALGKKIKAYRTAFRKSKGYKGRCGEEQKHVELLQESRRLTLLASNNPKEREEGEAMVTAGKIYAENIHDRDLATAQDIEVTGIGHIPGDKSSEMETNEQLESEDPDEIKHLAWPHSDVTAMEGADAAGDDSVDVKEEPQKKKRKAYVTKVWVWVPLTFPPVPKKGGFDISRLQESLYFFS